MISDIFLKVLGMSLTATYIVAVVLVMRVILKKAPKIFSYILWIAVAFRLICPISFSSSISIFNSDFFTSTKTEISDIISDNTQIDTFVPSNVFLLSGIIPIHTEIQKKKRKPLQHFPKRIPIQLQKKRKITYHRITRTKIK